MAARARRIGSCALSPSSGPGPSSSSSPRLPTPWLRPGWSTSSSTPGSTTTRCSPTSSSPTWESRRPTCTWAWALPPLSADWVLVYGDTNSTLAAALAAVKLHIPVAHLEAGLRSFNRAMPEEINRVLTDHAADLLLTPTAVGAEHLAAEGLATSTVVVGDVMTDVLLQVRDRVSGSPSPVMEELSLAEGSYSLATIHRAENTDDAERLEAVLDSLARVDHPVVILAHPRLVAKCAEHGLALESRGSLLVHPPLAYPDLIASALHARGVITDSGGLQKEAFLLRVPCTTVRPQTEWVETVELGWNRLVEPGEALVEAASRPRPTEPREADAHPYGDGHAAERVVQELTAHLPG